MGNSVSADKHPLGLERVGELGREEGDAGGWDTLGVHDYNVKAWRFCGRYKVRCEQIDFLQEGFTLDAGSTYLILLLRKTSPHSDTGANGTPHSQLSPAFASVFTPRGLKFPFSSFSNEANYVKSLYIFYGKSASALAKAKALKHGLDLEKILEHNHAGEMLFHAGGPERISERSILQPEVETKGAKKEPGFKSLSNGAPVVPAISMTKISSANAASGPPPAATTPSSFLAQNIANTAQHTAAPTTNPRKPAFSLNMSKLVETQSIKPIIPSLALGTVDVSGSGGGSSAREGGMPSDRSSASFTSTSLDSPLPTPPPQHRSGSHLTESTSTATTTQVISAKLPSGFSLKVPLIPNLKQQQQAPESPESVASAPPTEPADDEEEENEKLLYDRRERKMREASALCSQVEGHLFVSGQQPAEQLSTLLQSGITDIVNTAEMVVPCKYREYFQYYGIKMRDSPSENIMNYFPHCVAAVEQTRKKKGAILIHCHQGVSRSCTLVAAYLMWRHGLSPEDAVERVRDARGVARPNPGFLIRLQQWAQHLDSPPSIAVHRCSPFTDDSHVPPVLALQDPSESNTIHFDSNTCYPVLFWNHKKIFLWVGSHASDVVRQAALHLLPDVVYYSMRTSEDCESYKRWPVDVVQTPIIAVQGSAEETQLFSLMREASVQPVFSHPTSANPDASVNAIPSNWGAALRIWLAERRDDLSESAERARHSQRVGSAGVVSALHMESLDVKDMFVAVHQNGKTTFTCDSDYHEIGLDEEDFYDFQERMETRFCVFLKLRGDFRLMDVFIGEQALLDTEEPDTKAEEIIAAFKVWSKHVCSQRGFLFLQSLLQRRNGIARTAANHPSGGLCNQRNNFTYLSYYV